MEITIRDNLPIYDELKKRHSAPTENRWLKAKAIIREMPISNRELFMALVLHHCILTKESYKPDFNKSPLNTKIESGGKGISVKNAMKFDRDLQGILLQYLDEITS